jgi:hypothetical protein
LLLYGDGLLAPRPTPKPEDHPFSAVRDCLNVKSTKGRNYKQTKDKGKYKGKRKKQERMLITKKIKTK